MSLQNSNIKSYAKINLGLKVLDLLSDGYHSIITIMQEINFFDLISISKKEKSKIKLICNGPIDVPDDKTNLCYKAAKLIYDNYNCTNGVDISLTKNIPIGAGLGGGSSNAATVLKQLNDILELNISKNHLHELALEIGCDVPFFIDGGIQLCEGKGEKLTPLSVDLSKYFIILILPNFSISTKWAYSFFKNDLCKRFDSNKFRSFQHCVDWTLFENDFEKVINLTYPEIDQIRSVLESQKALFVSLSGSGSTMFGVFDDILNVDLTNHTLKSHNSHIVKPIFKN